MGLGDFIGEVFGGVDDAVKGFADLDLALTAMDGIGAATSGLWQHGMAPGLGAAWSEAIVPTYKFARHDVISPTLTTIAAGPGRVDPNDPRRRVPLLDPRHWVANFQAARGEMHTELDAEGNQLVDEEGNPVVRRRGVSPGQMLTYGLTVQPHMAFAGGQPEGFGGEGQPVYDFSNPEHRDAVFERGFGKYMSGTLDAVALWYTDPTVFAGKGAMALRRSQVIKPIRGTTDLHAAAYTGRAASLTEKLAAMPKAQRADVLSRMRVFRGNAAIQHLLTEADSADEMRTALRYAFDPTAKNLDNLNATADDIASKVDYLRDTRIPSLERALETSRANRLTGVGPEVWAADLSKARLELAEQRNHLLRAESGIDAAGSLTAVPRFTLPEKVALGLRMDIYQPTRYGVATRIIKSAGMGRVHTVDLNRPGDAVRGARTLLDRVGHGWHTAATDPTRAAPVGALVRPLSEAEKSARARGPALAAQQKGRLIAAVAKAEQEGPEATEAALKAVEDYAFGWYARRLGIEADDARAIMEAAWERRSQTMTSIGARKGKVYSAATDDAGRRLDMVDLGTEAGVRTVVPRPVATSQFYNRVPMLDVDQMARALKLHAHVLDDPTMRQKFLEHIRTGNTVGFDMATEAAEKLNRVWKPLTLMRLGWPMRVIADENLRIMATLGAMTHLPLLAGSVWHGAKESRAGYRVRDAVRARATAEARDKVHALTPQAHGARLREGIVTRIGQLDTELATYDARIREVGDALSRVAAQQGDQQELVRLADEMTKLSRDRRRMAFDREELTGRAAGLPEWDDEMRESWSALIAQAHKPSQMRKLEGPGRKFSGQIEYQLRSGQVVAFDDVFGGDFGAVTHDLTSGAMNTRHLAGLQDRNLNGLRLEAGESTVLHPVAPDNVVGANRKLYEQSYRQAWHADVNEQIASDPIMRRMLQGQTDEEISAWLKGSREGRRVRRMSESIHKGNVEDWVAASRAHVDHYLPVQALRDAALEGKATFELLEKAIPVPAARPDLHGEALRVTTGRSQIARRLNQIVDKMYRVLGTLPTDAISRHPMAAGVYRNSMRRQFDELDVADDGLVSAEDIVRMQRRAREETIKTVRNTLYDLTRETHLGHAMRFMAPFYNAWSDALTTWGRLFLDDPSRLARLAMMFEAPSKAGMVVTDARGDQFIVTNLPKEMHAWAGVTDQAVPKYFMRDFMFGGTSWYIPGSGPVVAVPAGMWARRRPDDFELLKPILPYGAGESVLDQVIPAHIMTTITRLKGHKSFDQVDYGRAVNMATQVLIAERAQGKNDYSPQEMAAEAERRANNMFTLKVANAWLSPYPASYRSGYHFYIDQHRRLQEQWRDKYPSGLDERGRSADEEFIDRYGEDYFAFTQSTSRTNTGGISPTVEGYRAYDKYKDLISANPDLGGLIVGPEDEGEFSFEVYRYQRNNAIGPGDPRRQREMADPQEAVIRAQVSQGWDLFRQVNTAIEADLQRRGLRTLSSVDAQDLRVYKQLAVKKIVERFPEWGKSYDTFTKGGGDRVVAQIESIIDDPRFEGRAGWSSLAEYLAARRQIVAELDRRNAAGGSAVMTAQSNDDLRVMWGLIKRKLTERDLAFADIHSRWLDNDNLESRATVAR